MEETVPLATPITAEAASALAFESGPLVVAPSARRKATGGGKRGRSKLLFTIAGLVVLAVAVGGAIWGAVWLYKYVKRMQPDGDLAAIKDTEKDNYKYALPSGSWDLNREVMTRLVVHFCLTRNKPNDNLALFVRDYQRRLPSEAEMLDVALFKLRNHFSPLEWERKPKPSFKFGNQPVALYLEFQGTDNNGVAMTGEVVVIGYQGFGYWFYTWCPVDQQETVAQEWPRLRENFTLLNRRDGWKESPREKDTQPIADLPYEVTFVKEVWKVRDPEKWDPSAQVVLVGYDPNEFKHSGKAASFRLLVLDKAEDAEKTYEAARKHLEEKEKVDYPETSLSLLKTKDGKDLKSFTDIGSVRGTLAKFQVRNTEDRVRFMVMGTVQAKDKTLMLLCDCDMARRDFWETEFAELLKGFKKKKE